MHGSPSSQLGHAVHAVAPASERVPGGHGAHAVSAFAEHAAVWYEPAAHVVHVWHSPPARYWFAGQLPQSLARGPEHAVQLAWQAEQTVSDVAPQAVAW